MTAVSARNDLLSNIQAITPSTRFRQQIGLEECMLPLGHNSPKFKGFAQIRPLDNITISRVTNLNPSGGGSFQNALQNGGSAGGDHMIVFEVGGVIECSSQGGQQDGLRVARSHNGFFTYIAGETAPSPGITVHSNTFWFKRGNWDMRHIRWRTGNRDDGSYLGLDNLNGFRMFVDERDEGINWRADHCSFSWGTDINFESFLKRCGQADITNCIFSFALASAGHSEGKHDGQLGITNAPEYPHFIAGNIFAFTADRNPFLPGSCITANNLQYSVASLNEFKENNFSFVGVKISNMANSQFGGVTQPIRFGSFFSDMDHEFYYPNSVFDKRALLKNGNRTTSQSYGGAATSANSEPFKSELTSTFPVGSMFMHPADVERYTLLNAGARPLDRDAVDEEVIRRIRAREFPDDLGRIDHEDDLNLDWRGPDTSRALGTIPTTQPELDKWIGGYRRSVQPQIDTTPPTSGIGSGQIRKNRTGKFGISKRSGISGT